MKTNHIVWQPVGRMLLVMKDEDITETSGGIILPEDNKIPTLTCIVLAAGPQVEPTFFTDKIIGSRILVSPQSAIPVSYESNNKRYLVDYEKVLAIAEPTRNQTKIEFDVFNDQQ